MLTCAIIAVDAVHQSPVAPVKEGSSNGTVGNTSNPLMPATNYTVRVRGANAVGAGDWSRPATFSTDEAGKCGNPADVVAYKATKSTMKGNIQSCLIGCAVNGNREACTVDCINKKVGLSKPCSECWYQQGLCTLQKVSTLMLPTRTSLQTAFLFFGVLLFPRCERADIV